MSGAYEFRKVYADCMTEDGEVFVVYLNYVKLAGVWTGRASVEHYTPDGQRLLAHALDSAPLVDASTPVSELPFEVELPDGAFRLEVEPVLGAWQPSSSPPVDSLTWKVLAARTRATVHHGGRTVAGTGYVDYVQITRPTRLIGMSRLRWGRVHLPDRTVVIEHITNVDGTRWDVGLDWRVGESSPRDLVGPSELDPQGAGGVDLSDGRLVLTPQRVLHDGDAFDAERVPRWIDRKACELFGGPTWETRWAGHAELGDVRVPALYESVRFG